MFIQKHYFALLQELSKTLTTIERPQLHDASASMFSRTQKAVPVAQAECHLLLIRSYIAKLFFLSQTKEFKN